MSGNCAARIKQADYPEENEGGRSYRATGTNPDNNCMDRTGCFSLSYRFNGRKQHVVCSASVEKHYARARRVLHRPSRHRRHHIACGHIQSFTLANNTYTAVETGANLMPFNRWPHGRRTIGRIARDLRRGRHRRTP